ncbi:MAG: CPBP family intramembrane metalloprotease [Defluviitaleaceae bacterium]|nr:CPBP family intramembrane metalloprotease [Defluviitaleaceae bacterium]
MIRKTPKLTAFIFFIIGTISMSAVFGWLVLFTGSIWPAVVAHAANNVLQNSRRG